MDRRGAIYVKMFQDLKRHVIFTGLQQEGMESRSNSYVRMATLEMIFLISVFVMIEKHSIEAKVKYESFLLIYRRSLIGRSHHRGRILLTNTPFLVCCIEKHRLKGPIQAGQGAA